MSKPLTDKQKERLRVLEPKLEIAVQQRDYQTAKTIVLDIQGILRQTLHYARLCQSKNKLFELAIENGEYQFAINGLLSNRQVLNRKTRIFLETTSLLAICYIRMQDVEKAKPYIREVLTNETVIKSERTRRVFRLEIINRFNEEVALSTLKSETKPSFDLEEIEKEVIRIIQNLSEQEIFAQLGQTAPNTTKDLMYLVYDYSVKQLTTSERLALPSPTQKIKDAEIGQTVFGSVKRVLYNSLCNPESEIYKTWYDNGMKAVLSKRYIQASVLSCVTNIGIGAPLLVASIIALVMKFGIEIYCELYKPLGLMDIRTK